MNTIHVNDFVTVTSPSIRSQRLGLGLPNSGLVVRVEDTTIGGFIHFRDGRGREAATLEDELTSGSDPVQTGKILRIRAFSEDLAL